MLDFSQFTMDDVGSYTLITTPAGERMLSTTSENTDASSESQFLGRISTEVVLDCGSRAVNVQI